MESDQTIRERAERRARQDRFLAAQQAFCDGHVRENTDKRGGWRVMKYERAQFAVVTASDAYRRGYEQIQWNSPQGDEPCRVTPSEETVQEGST